MQLIRPIADARGPAWLVEPMGSSSTGDPVALESWLLDPDLCVLAAPDVERALARQVGDDVLELLRAVLDGTYPRRKFHEQTVTWAIERGLVDRDGDGLALADVGQHTLNAYDAGWTPKPCRHASRRRVSVSYTGRAADQCTECGQVVMRR